MRKLFAVNRPRQLAGFDRRLQAVDNGLMNFYLHLGQLRMNRIAMRAHFRAEIADQAAVAKVSLLEKVKLNIEPLAKTVERLERVVPEGFRDVLLDHRKIAYEQFEAEGFFRLDVARESSLRYSRR